MVPGSQHTVYLVAHDLKTAWPFVLLLKVGTLTMCCHGFQRKILHWGARVYRGRERCNAKGLRRPQASNQPTSPSLKHLRQVNPSRMKLDPNVVSSCDEPTRHSYNSSSPGVKRAQRPSAPPLRSCIAPRAVQLSRYFSKDQTTAARHKSMRRMEFPSPRRSRLKKTSPVPCFRRAPAKVEGISPSRRQRQSKNTCARGGVQGFKMYQI